MTSGRGFTCASAPSGTASGASRLLVATPRNACSEHLAKAQVRG